MREDLPRLRPKYHVTLPQRKYCFSREDLPKQGSISNARPIIGLSRRTKASFSNASMSSYLKAKGMSETSLTPNYGAERKSSSAKLYESPRLRPKYHVTLPQRKYFPPLPFI
ncbi:hypothetical protein FH972_014601 [Carpinus fangiana]|uniref:Uncharacterized protein n=1 Tax=Carpinus fangiana TaxID=176857 RepID=A0A5N6RDQ1_9ROSI|nr:hypothetical protein FH972_014601 [Carpinus fangiana]